jgi:hypothetical protein
MELRSESDIAFHLASAFLAGTVPVDRRVACGT